MRSIIIDIYKASQDDRIKLHNHLNALGEKVYSGTGLRDRHYDCTIFECLPTTIEWSSAGSTQRKGAISINDFIKKFPVPSMKATTEDPKDYAIICAKASLEDRKLIYNYLGQLGHSMYKDTGFIKNSDKYYDGLSTTFRHNTTEWSTGPSESKKRITATNFINKFIKPVVATPEPISTTETPEKEPEMDIKVGDVYKNSSGNLNTITKVFDKFSIYYKTATGKEYHTKLSDIERNWKKVLHPVETTQPTTIPKYLTRAIKTGDYVERTKHYDTKMSEGSIWKVTKLSNANSLEVTDGRGRWDSDNFKVINPEHPSHPSYTASASTPTSTPPKTLTGFKHGDKVKVRSDLSRFTTYAMLSGVRASNSVTSSMKKLAGKIVTIKVLQPFNQYKIEENGSNWVDEMFDGLESEQTPISQTPIAPPPSPPFQIGDKVKLKDGLKDATYYNGITYFEVFKSRVTTGIIAKRQETSVGYQYYIDKIWHGEDALELDTHSLVSAATVAVTQPIDTLISSTATNISINRFDGVTGTPTGGTNQPTLKSEKKTMAQKIKDTAMVTLDQNKQAAIIAGKMEAGRILTKQVLKQIKPHIPMFVRGYLDTPLAPIIVANLVAAVGNHTQNKRVQQVSELMLLAAADATVQSFNLDKIIDDVLAGVKLPAGILDTDEE